MNHLQRSKQKWKRSDLILFLEKLELYVSAGLTINRGLEISAQGMPKRKALGIDAMRKSVESGASVSSALSQNVRIPKTILSLIEQGESSAELSSAFHTARILLEKEDELFKKCASALTYPLIIGAFAVLLTIGLMKGVMPQIIPMLKSLHVQLPLITRIVIFISDSLLSYGIYICIALIMCSIAASMAYRKIAFVRRSAHLCWSMVPLAGSLIYEYSTSVFLRSCGSLVAAGIPVHHAYKRTADAVSFLPLRDMLALRSGDVAQGAPLSKAFIHRRIPPHVPGLIAAGEASGTLGSSMLRAADILDRDIDHMLKRLTALIEPVMMAGMGCTVGAIAVSIMMPIYDISKVLQH